MLFFGFAAAVTLLSPYSPSYVSSYASAAAGVVGGDSGSTASGASRVGAERAGEGVGGSQAQGIGAGAQQALYDRDAVDCAGKGRGRSGVAGFGTPQKGHVRVPVALLQRTLQLRQTLPRTPTKKSPRQAQGKRNPPALHAVRQPLWWDGRGVGARRFARFPREAAPTDAPPRPAPSRDKVPSHAGRIQTELDEHVQAGGDLHPSYHTMGMDTTYQTVNDSLHDQERAFLRRLHDETQADARATPRNHNANTPPRAGWFQLPGVGSNDPPPDTNNTGSSPLAGETQPGLVGNRTSALEEQSGVPNTPTTTPLLAETPVSDNSKNGSTPLSAAAAAGATVQSPTYDKHSAPPSLLPEGTVGVTAASNTKNGLPVDARAPTHDEPSHPAPNGQATAKSSAARVGIEGGNNDDNNKEMEEALKNLAGLDTDSDNKSTVSGLTNEEMNSSEAEQELIAYLKEETEAIRQILEEDNHHNNNNEVSSLPSNSSTAYSSEMKSQLTSQTDRATKQAEDMLREMRNILAESQAQAATLQQQQQTAHGGFNNKGAFNNNTNKEPHKLDTGNSSEDWTVYWDSTHQRHYYHEANTNHVQWESPQVAVTPVRSTRRSARSYDDSNDDDAVVSDYTRTSRQVAPSSTLQRQQQAPAALSYRDVMPEVHAAGLGRESSSRRLRYQQMLKKRRQRTRRRRRIAGVALVALVAASVVWRNDKDESVVGNAVNRAAYRTVHPVLPASLQWDEPNVQFLGAVANAVLPASLQRWETPNQAAKTSAAALLERQKLEQQQQQQQQAARERREQEERERQHKKEQETARRNAALRDAERKAREAEELRRRIAQQEEEARRATDEALADVSVAAATAGGGTTTELVVTNGKPKRHWACNVPLAYLFHPKCWRDAKHNPLFDLKELLEAMMQ